MDFIDYIITRYDCQKENPGKLSSYRQAAELICMCWNELDVRFIEPYLDENMVWKGGVPHKVINGKAGFLKLMSQVFDSLQYSKRSYRADVDGSGDRSVAIVTVDGEYQDMMHRLKIEEGIIREIEVTPSGYWWLKQFGGKSPFGVVSQTSLHELAAAVAAIEQYVKTELGNKEITWATPFDLKNSHCQLSFTCDGLSYD